MNSCMAENMSNGFCAQAHARVPIPTIQGRTCKAERLSGPSSASHARAHAGSCPDARYSWTIRNPGAGGGFGGGVTS